MEESGAGRGTVGFVVSLCLVEPIADIILIDEMEKNQKKTNSRKPNSSDQLFTETDE